MIPVIGLLQSKVPGSGDHPLLPQVEVLTSLSVLQVKVSMDPPIELVRMITPVAVDGVGHTTALQKEYMYIDDFQQSNVLLRSVILVSFIPTQLSALMVTL